MADESEPTRYRRIHCGSWYIAAAHVLCRQGTWTGSQSLIAQLAAPPEVRGHGGTLPWLLSIYFTWRLGYLSLIWLSLALVSPRARVPLSGICLDLLFLLVPGACIARMVFRFRKIARYNREVYPGLLREWQRSHYCRRCGRWTLIRD
jgi:hypothetical protein